MDRPHKYALLFEAQSIQSYLFDTGRLQDTIGASELVAALTAEPLEQALHALGEDSAAIRFSRRAGGAFYAFCGRAEPLERLADLWTLVLAQLAPGLRFGLGLGHGTTCSGAFGDARGGLDADAGHPRPQFPLAPPVAARSPRTGAGAVGTDPRNKEWLDAATTGKRVYAPSGRDARQAPNRVTRRFEPEDSGLDASQWPRNMEEDFPFLGDDQGVALVHIDGNGLGQLLQTLKQACGTDDEKYLTVFKHFSEAIEEATEAAARQVVRELLLPEREGRDPDRKPSGGDGMLAARPIVLGGDDVTLLIRADLALEFVRRYALAFELHSEKAMGRLVDEGVQGLPKGLSVGAGILYLHARQPFYMAANLAEELTSAAKQVARGLTAGNGAQPSTLAFVRITGTLLEGLDETLACDHEVHADGLTWHDRLPAWSIHSRGDLPNLDDLLGLQALLASPELARGPMRQLLGLLEEAPDDARQRYRRWRQLMAKLHRGSLDRFDELFGRIAQTSGWTLDIDGGGAFPYLDDGKHRRTPLGDALALNAVASRLSTDGDDGKSQEQAA